MRRRSDVSPSSSFLIAFKPRQVILLEKQQRNPPMAKSRPEIQTTQLKPENESILASSVALWLENKGFSKLLKRFLSAAQIEDDNWKSKALDLNEIFSKYQEICISAQEDIKLQKNQEEHVIGTTETNGDANCTVPEKITSKKKKKKSKDDTAINQTGKAPEGITKIESYVNGKEEEIHKTSDGPTHNGDQVLEVTVDQSAKKKEDKKKKKSKSMSQSSEADGKQTNVTSEVTKSKDEVLSSKSSAKELLDGETKLDKKSEKISVEAAENGVSESKKASKKRKRIATDENENQSAQEVVVEELKAKKSKGLNGHADKQNKEENTKDADEVDNSGEQKSARKKHNSSAEPKTQNAFQRVKVEEVKFADERLQDNSYWAKDGAEIGYGAKAQEVLGQVKGRDFRHEKTKKKRGSYRGGQIDLHSHSIKFNYSDEE